MKTLNIFFLSIIAFASCNDNNSNDDSIQLPPEKSKAVIIRLADSLGEVNITLPVSYDTSYSWTHYSDCGKPCEKIKYRFQPKALPIEMESGFFCEMRKDSIDRLTISHSGYLPFQKETDSLFMSGVHERHKKNVLMSPNTYKINSDTLEKIGDRYFSIITIDLFDSSAMQFSKKVLSYASLKGNGVSFDFELITKQKGIATDSFINNSIYYLKTVRFH
jgi:hypothetical protein